MMDFHGELIDVRLQGIVSVWQPRQHVGRADRGGGGSGGGVGGGGGGRPGQQCSSGGEGAEFDELAAMDDG